MRKEQRLKDQKLVVRLFTSYLTVVVLAIFLVTLLVIRAIEDFYYQQSVRNLETRALLVDELLAQVPLAERDSLQGLCEELGRRIDTRITLIASNGNVIADSDKDPHTMDSHHDRPEVISALKTGEGIDRRPSYTLDQDRLYFAQLSKTRNDRIIVRVSFATQELANALEKVEARVLFGGLMVILVLAILNVFLSRQILKPIQIMEAGARRFARGKLKMKVPESNIQELGSLARSLNSMAAEIYDRIRVITQQKNEQMAILSSMTEGVLALDPQGEILSTNRSAETMFGFQSKTSKGRPLHEVIRHTELIDFAEHVLHSKKTTERVISIFEPEERVLNVIGSRMPAKKGSIGGAVLVIKDLTQIQRLEGVRKEFVANVSHELKTPITSIQGYVETLLDGALQDGKNAERFLEIIAKHATRLGQIVDDLLELSRIEEIHDASDNHLEKLELNPLIESTLNQFKNAAGKRSIELIAELSKDVKLPLNEKLFSHALGNLVDNAMKYSGDGTRIIIRTLKKKNNLFMEIQDQGQGIEEQHLTRIFERFYRVDKGRSREVGGTGLGLSIVKHIAHVHHAEVEVESKPGNGSTFRLIFPLS